MWRKRKKKGGEGGEKRGKGKGKERGRRKRTNIGVEELVVGGVGGSHKGGRDIEVENFVVFGGKVPVGGLVGGGGSGGVWNFFEEESGWVG